MKLFFISDIHGSAFYLSRALERFREEKADCILLLGDLLYHGARNSLPEGYDTKKAAALLNGAAPFITAVRGNCDSEVDQMVLNFPIQAAYAPVLLEGKRLFLTHGHLYNEDNPIPMNPGDALVSGHTHVPKIEKRDGVYYLNPGSISMPKEDSPHSYAIFEKNVFTVKDLDGRAFLKAELS